MHFQGKGFILVTILESDLTMCAYNENFREFGIVRVGEPHFHKHPVGEAVNRQNRHVEEFKIGFIAFAMLVLLNHLCTVVPNTPY